MAELRDVPFERTFDHGGRVISMTHPGHEAAVRHLSDGTAWVTCSCQPDLPWRHHPQQSRADVLNTFNAHLSFATRPGTRTD